LVVSPSTSEPAFPFHAEKEVPPKNSLALLSNRQVNRRLAGLAGKPTILIAEDSLDSREMMQLILETKGYRVLAAADGEGALEMASRNRPDAILLDLQLPRLDGLTVARNLRLKPIFAKLPIIIVSGHDPHRYREEAINAGCDEYLLKPINFDELQVVLDRMVSRKRRRRFKSA